MKQGQRIHRRIAKRRCGRNKPPAFYRFFYRFSMLIMIGLVAMLGYGISVKQGFVTGEDLLAVGTWFPFEKWFSLQDETVSAMPAYALLKDHYYSNGSNQAQAIGDGVVQSVEKQDQRYVILVKQDNGVIATYGTLESTAVKKDERIRRGDVLGTYQESLYLYFEKDGKELDLTQAKQG